jgi:hypothetical protein
MTNHQNGTDTGALQREARLMNLEKLIAEREVVTQEPLSIEPKELLSRYEALLARCVSEGLLTPSQQTESAKMARFGGISIASVIQEGKALKAWLDSEAERRAVEQEFSAAWPKKAVSAA